MAKTLDTTKLRELMLLERGFLEALYLGNSMQNRRTLASSTNVQLRMLIQVLFCIANAKISLKRSYEGSLSRSGRLSILHKNFNKVSHMKHLLRADRAEKLMILEKFTNYYDKLFYYLFHELSER